MEGKKLHWVRPKSVTLTAALPSNIITALKPNKDTQCFGNTSSDGEPNQI